MINYYHILGLSQNASQKEIKEAYRKLALRYHPDRNPGSNYSEERFKEISQAYHALRDPKRKLQHDHTLAYGTFKEKAGNVIYEYESPQQKRNRRRRPGGGQPTPRPPINSRKNIIGTAWAFGIFIIFALLVVGFSSYRNYQEEQLREKQNELAVEVFKKAENLFQQENYGYALQLLKTIDGQYNIPYDANGLKQEIFNKLEEEANHYFEKKNYQKAAANFQLLASNKPGYDALTYAKLVSSYEMAGDYPKIIHTYKEIIKIEPLTIEARIRLAALYFKVGEYEQALDFYQQASDIVTRGYQNIYGKAYALVVNPVKTPTSHYELHCGLSRTYTQLGMFREARNALKWAIFLRPEEHEAHFLMGNNWWKEGRVSEACKKWEEAKKKGSEEAEQQLKKHCK